MENIGNLSQNEVSSLKEKRKQNLGELKFILQGLTNSGSKFLILNILLILTVTLILLNQMIQGTSYSSLYFVLSTVSFVVLISLSLFLLVVTLSKIHNFQLKVLDMFIFQDENSENEWTGIFDEARNSYKKSASYISSSVLITSISLILYCLFVLLIYFS